MLRAPSHSPTPAARPVPPLARRAVLVVAGVTGLAHLVAAGIGGGYFFDEILMLAIGRHHLDWGSADQPPLVPLLAAAADAVAPGSIVVLRLPAVLATAAAVVVAALIARELGGDRRAQLLTAGAQATSFWAAVSGHWLTPYTLEPVQWLALCWLLVRWVRTRDDRLLLVLGVVAGVAMQTKFQVALLCAALLVAVVVCGPRELLRRPALRAAAVIGAVLALPTLLWQQANGWPQLRMASVVADEVRYAYGGRSGTVVLLVVTAGVAGAGLALYGVLRLLRAPELRPYRFLAVAAVLLYVVFVVTLGRFYYLAGLHGALAAAGAAGLQLRRAAGRPGRRAWPYYAVSALLAIGGLAASVPAAPPDVPRAIARATADAYRSLPDAQRARTAVVGNSYIYAAYLDAYSDEAGLPLAYSGNRSYGYFTPPPDGRDTVLYVGPYPEPLAPWFGEVRRIGDVGDDAGLWLLTGRRASWTEIWPAIRTLSVS